MALHLKKVESSLPMEAWPGGSLNFVNVFSLFRNYLLLEKRMTLHLNRLPTTQRCFVPRLVKDVTLHLNKLETPSPKDAFCQN